VQRKIPKRFDAYGMKAYDIKADVIGGSIDLFASSEVCWGEMERNAIKPSCSIARVPFELAEGRGLSNFLAGGRW
jgi:hypothetical protein